MKQLPYDLVDGAHHFLIHTAKMTTTLLLALLICLPCLPAFGALPPTRCAISTVRARAQRLDRGHSWQQRAVVPRMADSDLVDEEELDKLVRAEIEAAFAGLEEKFANGEDEEAIKIIQSQGAGVLSAVLDKLDEDGKLLSGQLANKIEQLAADESAQMVERYEREIDETRQKMDADRLAIRAEVERLEELNKELQSLQVRLGPRPKDPSKCPDIPVPRATVRTCLLTDPLHVSSSRRELAG